MPNALRQAASVTVATAVVVTVIVVGTRLSMAIAARVGVVLGGVGLLAAVRTLLSGVYTSDDSITIRRIFSNTRIHARQIDHADAEGPFYGEIGQAGGGVWVALILAHGIRVNLYHDSLDSQGNTRAGAYEFVQQVNNWLTDYRSRHPSSAANE